MFEVETKKMTRKERCSCWNDFHGVAPQKNNTWQCQKILGQSWLDSLWPHHFQLCIALVKKHLPPGHLFLLLSSTTVGGAAGLLHCNRSDRGFVQSFPPIILYPFLSCPFGLNIYGLVKTNMEWGSWPAYRVSRSCQKDPKFASLQLIL